MYTEQLKKLEDNTESNGSHIWGITLRSDGSGELIHPTEANLTIFNSEEDLARYVDALIDANKILTVSACVEIIMESDGVQ